jgi:hypothetical protein
LGGQVFPKLNWSSPKDATWIATEKNLKCRNYADIFLLLKSSDFVTHDLTCAFDSFQNVQNHHHHTNNTVNLLDRMSIKETSTANSSSGIHDYINNNNNTNMALTAAGAPSRPRRFELILRKWCNLSRAMEFRCFVRNSQLIAITQRDYINYYDFLKEDKDNLEDLILDFFDNHVADVFPLSNCKNSI